LVERLPDRCQVEAVEAADPDDRDLGAPYQLSDLRDGHSQLASYAGSVEELRRRGTTN
jgi:hypothetical protein